MKKCNIGGQGVLEGVMMRAPSMCGLAVRKASGKIVYEKQKVESATQKNKFYKLPIIRGLVSFVEMMGFGVKTLTKSAKMFDDEAEEYKPSRFEKFLADKTGKDIMDVAMVVAVIVAIALAVGIFFILPTVITNLVRPYIASAFLMNMVEGGVRLLLFFGYVIAITFIKDIKRVFKYHGSEHKTINCYEHEEPLTVENVQKYKTLHPRCGTSYLLLVMVISILLFSIFGWSDVWYVRIGIRLLMLPVVAGVSYEFLKFAAKGESLFFRVIRWPGMMLQKLTTAPPDDEMVEVAIVAFKAAEDELSDDELAELAQSFDRSPVSEDETAAAPEDEKAEDITAGEMEIIQET